MKLETGDASKKTAEGLKYGDNLMEALDKAEAFREEIEQFDMAKQTYEEQVKKLKEGKLNDFDRMALSKPQRPKVPYDLQGLTVYDVIL